MVIIWVWRWHGGMVILDTWFTQEYSCSIRIFDYKMTRHETNIGEISGENWGNVSWVPLPMYKVWWCLFYMVHITLWHGLLMSIYYLYITKLYYSWHGFPLGYMEAFSTNSFLTTIIIDWYARIGCGMGCSHFRVLGPNWHA